MGVRDLRATRNAIQSPNRASARQTLHLFVVCAAVAATVATIGCNGSGDAYSADQEKTMRQQAAAMHDPGKLPPEIARARMAANAALSSQAHLVPPPPPTTGK